MFYDILVIGRLLEFVGLLELAFHDFFLGPDLFFVGTVANFFGSHSEVGE
jgi:hypothetical protein